MKIEAGVIGTGFIGPVHIGGLRRIPGIHVKALADAGPDVSRAKAAELGVGQWHGDYQQLLKDDDIQVVHICVPNHLHYEVARAALQAGKHVICEKPLAMTVAEARELTELAHTRKLVNAIHFNIRYYPLIRQLKTMVERGEMGRIFSVHGSFLQDWLFYDTDYNWRLESSLSGTSRAVADIGSHWMDLIEHVSGLRIVQVFSDFATMHKTRKKPKKPVETYSNMLLKPEDYAEIPIDTEDYATVLFRFQDGERGCLTVSQVSAGRKCRLWFELDGSKQSAAWDSESPNQLWLGHREKSNELLLRDPSLAYPEATRLMTVPAGHNEGFHDTSRALFMEVYQAVRDNCVGEAPLYPTFRDGLREMRILDAVLQSNTTQSWVGIEE
ncbi:MAG: gfo/Idh/MocA family oxidoreductase [Spirochaetaceae bacterium]|nr:MAG: gfo/Idh/MocA family oxidoreductase [Spirochaetaceae bacterium]